MTEWKECKLGEFANIIMGQSPESSYYNIKGEGIPFLQGNRTFGFKYPTFDTYTTFITKEANKDDVIMSVRAPVGDLNIAPERLCLGRGVCALRAINGEQLFLYYLMKANQKQLLNKENGTVFGSVNRNDISNLIINLPSLENQKKIATILSTLDDKIELNNKINDNLEQQAQAIFKSWFVDFEPFGGKMPDDWKIGKLSEIADYLNGLAMQKFRPAENEEALSVLKIKELRQGICDDSSELCSPNKIKPKFIINDGDVIFSWSGSLLVDIWCGGKCGLNQHLFKVTSKNYDKWYYYLWTKHHLDRFIFLAADKATTMGHIKREELDKAEVVIPSESDMKKIGSVLQPIIDMIINNKIENIRLSKIRDELLPQLMNGSLSVDEVVL